MCWDVNQNILFFLKKKTKTLGVSSFVFFFCVNCGFVGSVADKVKLAEENVHHLCRRVSKYRLLVHCQVYQVKSLSVSRAKKEHETCVNATGAQNNILFQVGVQLTVINVVQ